MFKPYEVRELAKSILILAEEAYAAKDTADLHDLIGICEERLRDLAQIEKCNPHKKRCEEHQISKDSSQLTLAIAREVVDALESGRPLTSQTMRGIFGMLGIDFTEELQTVPAGFETHSLGLG